MMRRKWNRDRQSGRNMPQIASPNPKDKKQSKKLTFADKLEELNDTEDESELPQPRQLNTEFKNKEGTDATVVTPTDTETSRDATPPLAYDWVLEGKFEATAVFKKTAQLFVDRASAFKKDQVYPDEGNPETVHDLTRFVKATVNRGGNPRHEPSEEEYHSILIQAQNPKDPLGKTKEGKRMMTIGLRLSKTTPEIFQDCYDKQSGQLLDRSDTRLWHAANRVYGSNWTWTTKPKATAKPKPAQGPAKKLQQAALRFDNQAGKKQPAKDTPESGKWSVVQTKRGLFRKKDTPPEAKSQKLSSKEVARSHRTFLKLRLPKIKAANTADEEAATALVTAINALIKIDQKLIVLPWDKFSRQNDNKQYKALAKASQKPSTKEGIEPYVDHLFVQAGRWPYVRMLIGHEIEPSMFDDADNSILNDLKNKGIMVYKERIQDAQISTAGWLMGSHPTSFNARTFHPVLQSHHLLANCNIDLQIKAIRIDSQHKWSPKDPRAVHVLCAKHQLAKVKQAMFTIYGSKSSVANMPMGRSMRFIPFTADPRGMTPLPDLKRNIQTAIIKQSRFIANTATAELVGVLDLDYSIKVQDQNLTVRETLQSMKASDFQANMFLAIDEKWNGNVVLTFHSSLADQAQLITSYLPLLVTERFGSVAWKWFTADTQARLSGFYWDEDAQGIKTKDNEAIAANIEGFDDFEEDIENLSDGDSVEELQQDMIKIDLGMQFDLNDPPTDARIVGDEDRSLATFGGGLKETHPPSGTDDSNDTTSATTDPSTANQPDRIYLSQQGNYRCKDDRYRRYFHQYQ